VASLAQTRLTENTKREIRSLIVMRASRASVHSNMGHNSGACAPSRITSLWSRIASLNGRRVTIHLALVYDVHSAVGRRARTTAGLVVAAMSGIRSTQEECARLASISGLRHNASRAPAGRPTQNGMCSNAFTGGSKPHTAAKVETTGYARACRRAFDSQPRGRSGVSGLVSGTAKMRSSHSISAMVCSASIRHNI
jgi:hypothetical protein